MERLAGATPNDCVDGASEGSGEWPPGLWRIAGFGGCEVGEAIDMGRYGDVPEALPDEKRWWESEC